MDTSQPGIAGIIALIAPGLMELQSNANVSFECNGSTITRNWGTFTDCNDGTVSLVITTGTFGGQGYTAQSLTWMKCSHGQVWNSVSNDCTGTGTANLWGGTLVQYCNGNNQSCNDDTTGILDGNGTSSVYTACNTLNTANAGAGTFGKTNWRVPEKNELKLLIECTNTEILPNDLSNCEGATSPSINTLFPNTVATGYRSSTAFAPTTAWAVDFVNGTVVNILKTSNYYVRCVSGP